MVQTVRFVRHRLPHWVVADRSYFVTLCLKGALPPKVMAELRRERDELAKSNPGDHSAMRGLAQRQFARIEAILDSAREGTRHLAEAAIADMVLEAMQWLEAERMWKIHAAVVMPTHLHMLLRNQNGRNDALLEDLASFKNYTAVQANRLLGRTGPFWLREDFDHWCRNPDKLESAIEYVRNNPVHAGLAEKPEDWPWVK